MESYTDGFTAVTMFGRCKDEEEVREVGTTVTGLRILRFWMPGTKGALFLRWKWGITKGALHYCIPLSCAIFGCLLWQTRHGAAKFPFSELQDSSAISGQVSSEIL